MLHTSDWHLGRMLYDKKRSEEQERFLNWLLQQMQQEKVDVLLIAGDIFDTTTPGIRAQELYFRFLSEVVKSACRHVVVVGGNHDSPSFLEAPKEILKVLDVHVIGSIPASLEDEVLVFKDDQGVEELIVCAVPYLRDRDIRTVANGETLTDKEQKLISGVQNHYRQVCAMAQQRRSQLSHWVPIFATGHLFTAGGQTQEGDGVRELYVGSLAAVDSGSFPSSIDYLALGHLHIPQVIAGKETMRYCGSPIPMGFKEAKQQKHLCLIQCNTSTLTVQTLPVPAFQALEQIRGDFHHIAERLQELVNQNSSIWVEVFYEGEGVEESHFRVSDLSARLNEIVQRTNVEILRIRNLRCTEQVLSGGYPRESLEDLDELQVFQRCMDAAGNFPDQQKDLLLTAYREILKSLQEE